MADTLCGTCARGADECRFMARLIPVPGWVAEKIVYEKQNGKRSYTYAVKECPLYVEMPPDNQKQHHTKKCARCGKEFTPKSGPQKYCSKSCALMGKGDE